MIRIASVAAVFVGLLAGGCTPQFAVRYSLRDVHSRKDPILAQVSLRIGPLRDERWSDPHALQFYGARREIKSDGHTLCVNAEHGYRAPAVSEQVAQAIAAHLRKMETYAAVTTDELPNSYVLRGALRHFFGVQHAMSDVAAGVNMAAFGSPGLGRSQGIVDVKLTNLELLGPDGQPVARLADIVEHYEGELDVDTFCNVIFLSVNNQLEVVVDRLAARLAAELHGVVAARPAPSPVARTTPTNDSGSHPLPSHTYD